MSPHHTPVRGTRRRRPRVAGAVLVALIGLGASACTGGETPSISAEGAGSSSGSSGGGRAPASTPSVSLVGATAQGVVKWDARLKVAATDGTITDVTGADSSGDAVAGAVGADGVWIASKTLMPSSTYALTATVVDGDGETRALPLTAKTTAPTKTLTAALSPGDGKVVGVGQTVAVRLDRDVKTAADRQAVEARLKVRTTPAQPGAWRWVEARELHYRSATYWKPATRISVTTDLTRLKLANGVWGAGARSSTFTIGQELQTVVDVENHTMTVSRGGKVLRTMKASMGKPGFDTRSGNFLVLEKFATKVMDGSTLAVPQDYSTKVKHAVRITNSGTFTHGAPWSLGAQGNRNVSHGCINLSPADAKFFYDIAKRGDVVRVINSSSKANTFDAGSRDWNISWAEWQSDSDGA